MTDFELGILVGFVFTASGFSILICHWLNKRLDAVEKKL